MFTVHALHFLSLHKPEIALALGSIGAATATAANYNHLHDLATIAGSLATIATVLAAVWTGKRSRGIRRRKPRAIQPEKQPKQK